MIVKNKALRVIVINIEMSTPSPGSFKNINTIYEGRPVGDNDEQDLSPNLYLPCPTTPNIKANHRHDKPWKCRIIDAKISFEMGSIYDLQLGLVVIFLGMKLYLMRSDV